MSGREVFEFNPTLIMEDDDDNEGEVFIHSRSQVIVVGVWHGSVRGVACHKYVL